MTKTDPEGFESFPRGRLSLRWDRRQLLSALTSEVRVLFDVHRWGASRRLTDLGEMPDELLELMKPGLADGVQIVNKDGFVWGHLPLGQPQKLFSAHSLGAAAFRRFDGQTPLVVIARRLAEEVSWDEARTFACVRGVFLHLVTLGICLPR